MYKYSWLNSSLPKSVNCPLSSAFLHPNTTKQLYILNNRTQCVVTAVKIFNTVLSPHRPELLCVKLVDDIKFQVNTCSEFLPILKFTL
jgi:hypothetical protein